MELLIGKEWGVDESAVLGDDTLLLAQLRDPLLTHQLVAALSFPRVLRVASMGTLRNECAR